MKDRRTLDSLMEYWKDVPLSEVIDIRDDKELLESTKETYADIMKWEADIESEIAMMDNNVSILESLDARQIRESLLPSLKSARNNLSKALDNIRRAKMDLHYIRKAR